MMNTWHNVVMCPKFKKKKNKKKRKEDKKYKKEGEGTDGRGGRGGGGARREREGKEKKSLLSKIYGNRTLGFRRSRRQSRSTHRELCVGTKILEFRQTPRGREFSYLGYF